MTTAAIASLIVGLIIGFVGQRSRMCFVGGIRDFILVRDTQLLRGLVSFGLVAWIAFPASEMLGGVGVGDFSAPTVTTVALAVVGGFGVGYVSILANGCPFRQHVLAAQGSVNSIIYLTGFFTGAVVFHTVVSPLIQRFVF